ncbi:hypothetical protein [Streptacidiphilus sp. PAMC 29251]
MTDWEARLRQRAEDVKAAQRARALDIAAAHAAGLSWRAIGKAADVNHETARTLAREALKATPLSPDA